MKKIILFLGALICTLSNVFALDINKYDDETKAAAKSKQAQAMLGHWEKYDTDDYIELKAQGKAEFGVFMSESIDYSHQVTFKCKVPATWTKKGELLTITPNTSLTVVTYTLDDDSWSASEKAQYKSILDQAKAQVQSKVRKQKFPVLYYDVYKCNQYVLIVNSPAEGVEYFYSKDGFGKIEEEKKAEEAAYQARQDSINAVREAERIAYQARQDSINAVREAERRAEQARRDSIKAAKEAEKAEAERKAREIAEKETTLYDSNNDLKFIFNGPTQWTLGSYNDLFPNIDKMIVDAEEITPRSNFEFGSGRHYVIIKTKGLEKLPQKTFYDDPDLIEMHIPACVKKIGDYNGQKCKKLKDIYSYATVAPKGALIPLLFYDLENSSYRCGYSVNNKTLHILKDATKYNKSPWSALIEKCDFSFGYIEQ